MGLKRIGNGTYYYKSVREGGRVRSEYRGRGPFAELYALLGEQSRLRRAAERQVRQAVEEQEHEIVEWFDDVEAVARLALTAAGYRRHHRGEWRKHRG
jgi:hypothetical protein